MDVGSTKKKEIDNKARNRRINEITKKTLELDEICSNIFLTLLAYKKMRFNELLRTQKKLGSNISKPTLSDHLKHLIDQQLVERKVEGVQNVTYGLSKEIASILDRSEDLPSWFDSLFFVLEPSNAKQQYEKMSKSKLSAELDRDLKGVLLQNLHELRAVVNRQLKLDKNDTDAEFWKFIGNPIYRLFEKTIADNCRDSSRYREAFFEKIESLIEEFEEEMMIDWS